MGYYLRYISTHELAVTMQQLTDALIALDANYKLVPSPIEDTRAELLYVEQLLGELEINLPDDGIFEEDIEELIELVEGIEDPNEQRVLDTLNQATFILAISATWEGNESHPVLSKLEALWDWLFAHHKGLLQADNEGFYDNSELILELNLKI